MMGYRAALEWLIRNDDCCWLDEDDDIEVLSVSASLVADIYGKDDEKVVKDLLRTREKMKKEGMI